MYVERVVTDEKVIGWRRECFALLGFEGEECARLASRAGVSVRDVERWLAAGATHLQVLAIVQPLDPVWLEVGVVTDETGATLGTFEVET